MSNGGACVRFKQNAWKKDMCSNCYRPKEEHQELPKPPPPSLPLIDPSQSILMNLNKKKKVKKKSVRFTEKESEVIGYGGADSSSEEDDYEWVETKEEEREVTGEEEKALEKLTKSNTDYNSFLGNLNSNTGILPLGKQQKQTLQVTIQPFGMPDSRKTHLNKLLQEEAPIISPLPEIKETKVQEEKEDKISKEEQAMPLMKTIIIENKAPAKEETRGNPEGRKTQITRGSMITKNHEQVKNKLYIQNVIQTKMENRRSITQLKDDNEKKTDSEINRIIINTGPNVEENNARNTSSTDKVKESEVTVKVLKLVGNGLAESREMAGEPDGKADSDEPETPLTPPPRSSFLHREAQVSVTVSPSEPMASPTQMTPPTTGPLPMDVALPMPVPIPMTVSSPMTAVPTPLIVSLPVALPSPMTVTCPVLPPNSPPPTPPPPSPPASPPARSKRPAPKPPAPEPRRRGSLTDSVEKKKTRVRHTLRKLLRFGSREEEPKTPEDDGPPKPRPQIIHPLDLNKSAVQVLPPASPEKSTPEIYMSTTSLACYSVGRPSKPPPPPRSESLNLMERLRPSPNSENNVYANLGEGRCGITPVKPQRTGSMRDSNPATTKDMTPEELPKQCSIQTDSDNVYECVGVSSAPECDMSLPPYYGSETESDIYYPYITFQNGECKTKMKRKERGIVHSTLEENYGAVIIANHDALTNLFQQIMSKKPDMPKELQEIELNWKAFIIDDEEVQKMGNLTFFNARVKDLPLTLSVTTIESCIPDIMEPLSQFKCIAPIKCLQNNTMAYVTVMRRKKIERLSIFAKKLEKSVESVREGVYILLQVVKYLSITKGKVNPENFVVFMYENSPSAAYLPLEVSERDSVEDCLSQMSKQLLGALPLGKVLEKCNVAEAEGVLEVWLWGPASPLALPSLARWLDLERANFLNTLISINGTTALIDKEQLAFLVRATPKSIAHSSQIIEHSAS